MEYYFADGSGAQQGPVSVDQLVPRGVRPETLVWAEGMPQWIRADSVPDLQQIFHHPAPPQAPPMFQAAGMSAQQQYAPPGVPQQYPPGQFAMPGQYPGADKKMAAGLCGILLGAFGIHKFILGFTTAGVVMLVVTILGACLYGLGPIVMGIIGLIEGIIYLTKSDADFYQTYIVQKKSWF